MTVGQAPTEWLSRELFECLNPDAQFYRINGACQTIFASIDVCCHILPLIDPPAFEWSGDDWLVRFSSGTKNLWRNTIKKLTSAS